MQVEGRKSPSAVIPLPMATDAERKAAQRAKAKALGRCIVCCQTCLYCGKTHPKPHRKAMPEPQRATCIACSRKAQERIDGYRRNKH